MAYIGNIPAEKYVSLAVQHFSTTATASYTLSNSVTNENGISLFINNVRQEPGSGYAYTAAGTALTLSAATAESDTMYCVYLGKAIGTITPPDGSVNSAKIVDGSITDGDLAGSITSAKITSLDATKLTGNVDIARLPSTVLNSNVPATNTSVLEHNIAMLAFKLASSNQLTKFAMVDQMVDEYQDATGIDTGASTNELADGTGTAKYYEGGTAGADPTGGDTNGTYTLDSVNYGWRAFTTTGSQNLVIAAGGSIDLMLIAGGGGGGADTGATGSGGGGGAGGLKYYVGRTVAAGTHVIVVGTGGAGATAHNVKGTSGVATTFTASGLSAISATGGGGAGSRSTNQALNGGSGGGGGQRDNTSANYGTGVTNEGYRGGSGNEAAAMSGGGGGGAGAVGSDSTSGSGGNGGAGVVEGTTSVYDWQAGSSTTLKINGAGSSYAGGGGGAGASSQGTASHGGGAVGAVGTVNTGGGGGAHSSVTGFAGGHGIAIIRYVVGSFSASGGDLILKSNAATNAPATAPTTGDLVILIDDGGSGTTTEDVNVKAYISRNGNFNTLNTDHKQAEFTDEGSWGTAKQRILVSRNVDISGITTGTSMKYMITTHSQSAGTMETRIHATSLAWA
jgi:hypothetical protein